MAEEHQAQLAVRSDGAVNGIGESNLPYRVVSLDASWTWNANEGLSVHKALLMNVHLQGKVCLPLRCAEATSNF